MSEVPWETFTGHPDIPNHTGLLLAEDEALKDYLSGLVVPGLNGGTTDVDVWFRFPEGETRLSYPFITIDFLGINPSYERWTSVFDMDPLNEAVFRDMETGREVRRGLYTPSESPTLSVSVDEHDTGAQVDPYLMHKILYQVTVYSRNALHDRYLTSLFITDVFPPRPFFIPVDADMTVRRTELLQMDQADTMETTDTGNKRIFRKVYTISMDAEIQQSTITELARVHRIHIDLYSDPFDGPHEEVDHPSDGPHTLAFPINVDPPE